jgi:protein-disulfide isomerase
MDLAREIGATGTPAFRINGVTVSGAQPFEKFVEVVEEQLAAAKAMLAAGTPARLVYVSLTDKNLVLPAPPSPEEDEEEDTKVWNIPVSVEDTLTELRKLYDQELRLVWKDNPLPFHQRAMPAAMMGRYVFQKKGNDAFWSLHDALFESAPQLEESDLEKLAKRQALPWPPLRALIAGKPQQKLEQSIELASDFEARGTPHFFINGRRLAGAQPLASFRALVDVELAKARALVEKGTPRAKVYAELMKTAENPPAPPKLRIDARADAPSRGNAKAPVTIQIFSDFQCPFCRRVEPTLSELEKEQKGNVRFVWRHLPLPFHSYAALAAEASEEVLAQKGPAAFWAYHDDLFEAQGIDGGLARDNLEALAAKQGVDANRFRQALDSRQHRAKVEADAAVANEAGINGTPSFVINDYYLSGAQPLTAFRKLVKRALKDAGKP